MTPMRFEQLGPILVRSTDMRIEQHLWPKSIPAKINLEVAKELGRWCVLFRADYSSSHFLVTKENVGRSRTVGSP